jgi:hypothetical protein
VRLDNLHSAAHGTTRSIPSRNSRLRVFFVDRLRPSPSCFIALPQLPVMASDGARLGPVCRPS